MKRLLLVVVVVGAALLISISGGSAATVIAFPLDQFIGVPPGSTQDMGTVPVPPEAQGLVCVVIAVNNESVHPGSGVTFTSDGNTVTLSDIESSSGKVTTGTLLLSGTTIHAEALIGPDGIFSGGADANFVCPEGTSVTTPTTTPTTTTLPPTTTTTVVPGGSEVVVVQPAFTG